VVKALEVKAMSKTNGKPLRFAALIRVSTERQEKQGESLRTQQAQIDAAVKQLGGTIAQRYAGQEHATAGWEREQRDKMLAEADKPRKPFDAVIVAHEDRWSRDDTRSGADLERLQQAGIRFFVLDREQNLSDPTIRFYLGMSALIGAYHARNQTKKAFENRIERAKRGIPTCGKLPFGRTFDKQTSQWVIDPEKQAMIRDIAERYLAGERLWNLATEYGANYGNITRALRSRCGTTYTFRFQSNELKIDETLTLTVPRLLPEKLIREVCQRLDANRTYMHGKPKREYLLGGRIFCAACGFSLTGGCNHSGKRYYRHNRRYSTCKLRPRLWVPADVIEPVVVRDLFNMLGNPAAIERAVKSAVPDCDKALKQRERLEAELAKIEKARNRVLDLIERDTITDAQATAKLQALKERETALRGELDKLAAMLADVPDADTMRQAALEIQEVCGAIFIVDDAGNTYAGGNDVQSFRMMEPGDRRKLIDAAFSGNLPDGKPAGVYISPAGEDSRGRRRFTYVLRGRLLGARRGGLKYSCP
jgi:DNA invertase Pin-like site-specific DNA recombinase